MLGQNPHLSHPHLGNATSTFLASSIHGQHVAVDILPDFLEVASGRNSGDVHVFCIGPSIVLEHRHTAVLALIRHTGTYIGHNAIREKALVHPPNEDLWHNASKELLSYDLFEWERAEAALKVTTEFS